jgi:CheY-like chemotaxis protein
MKSRKRILVADDNPLIRKTLCELFENHERLEICDEAANGLDAVEKARKLRPDLIILDLSMPVLNGLQAAEAIKEFLPQVPIILFTMYAHQLLQFGETAPNIKRVVSKNEAQTIVRHCEELLLAA